MCVCTMYYNQLTRIFSLGCRTLYCGGELPVLVRYSLIDLLAALLKMCVQYNIDLHVTRKRKKRG